jgi:hypothetical protein
MRHRVTGPSRRMTGNVAPRGVGQGTTGFARGAPFFTAMSPPVDSSVASAQI